MAGGRFVFHLVEMQTNTCILRTFCFIFLFNQNVNSGYIDGVEAHVLNNQPSKTFGKVQC